MSGDVDPLCDISGSCEPFEEEEHLPIAMCRYCGGERYRNYPYFGNWGTWDEGTEKFLAERQNS